MYPKHYVFSVKSKFFPFQVSFIGEVMKKWYDKNNPVYQHYRFAGKQAMTKYDMLKVMANVFQIDMSHISPENGPGAGGATRPYNAQLANTKAESLGIGKHTSFSEGIESCLRPWLKQRKN